MQARFMPSSIFTAAGEKDFPSFAAGDGSPICISAAEEWLRPATNKEEEESMDGNFEFTFSADQGRDGISNMVSIGQIFPVLDSGSLTGTPTEAVQFQLRQLLIEERTTSYRSSTSSSSSSVNETDGILPNKFCLWEPRSVPPSPNRWKKSKSTGSSSRRWRLRDLVFGRSHSDGKDKFGFLAPEERNGREATKGKKKEKNLTEMDIVTAHRLYYAKSSGGVRRSFLPYKQDIIGFFGQAHHPF